MKTFKDYMPAIGFILICMIAAALITTAMCLLADCSWERIFVEIIPPIMICIIATIAVVIIVPWPPYDSIRCIIRTMIILAVVIGLVLIFKAYIYSPMLETRTEHCTTGSFSITSEDGWLVVHPDTDIIVSRDKDGNIVTIDPEEKFKIWTSDVRIWDTDSFSFDLRKYSDTDYDVVKKSLTLTAETAKKIGLAETDVR